jgi:hypothetical protein
MAMSLSPFAGGFRGTAHGPDGSHNLPDLCVPFLDVRRA